jgi:PAS domain S-box-containing protein
MIEQAHPGRPALSNSSRAVLIALLMALIFAIDLRVPFGVAAGIPYVVPVLLTLWFLRTRLPLLVAAATTVLVGAGYLLAEHQVRATPYLLTNRLLAIGAIWITAVLVALYSSADRARQSSDATARERWQQLEQIYQTAPVGLCLVDRDLRYIFINERLAVINGRPLADHHGRTIREVVPEIAQAVGPMYQRVFETGEPVLAVEVSGTTPADPQTQRSWMVCYYPVKSAEGEVRAVNTVVLDITDRKRMEEALRESEATARAYLESASQAVLGVDGSGRIVLANAMAEEIFGSTREELLGKPVEMLLPERLRGQHAGHRAAFFAEPRRRPMGIGLELFAQRKDGSAFPVDVSLSHLDTPKGRVALAFVSDLSERVRQQEELRDAESIRTLTAGLLRGQERERRRISRELHDGLNQWLAALSMELSALGGQLTAPDAARERLHSIEERVMTISDEVRRISHELHPSILEHAGLVAALRSHCREFSQQTQIDAQVTNDNAPESIDPVAGTALFRLSQEALQNVAKHSGATQVRLCVSGVGQGIRLSIADNGKGFDTGRRQTAGGLGLISMNERVRSLGGRLSIESSPQGGVRLTVWVPLSTPPDA